MIKVNSLTEKGIIIATGEKRIAEWMSEYIKPCIDKRFSLGCAVTRDEFNTLVLLPGIVAVFIETDFFGEETIGVLDSLHKAKSGLQIILFSVSDMPLKDAGRYMWWGGDSFISLRNSPELIREQIKAIIRRRNNVPVDVLDSMREYSGLSTKPPHFTPREIEVSRCITREKTIKETAKILAIGEHTVTNYLDRLYRKCGVNNMVGLVKAAFTAGIITADDLLVAFRDTSWEE